MSFINIEIKARCKNRNEIRDILERKGAKFVGSDRQIDTYFVVPNGRLKLRAGNIENALIHYVRENKASPKDSIINLYTCGTNDTTHLKQVLNAALTTWIEVDKVRDIYFIENVKFHLDIVEGLGEFIEIEAIDEIGNIGKEKLQKQCAYYMELFQIEQKDLIPISYSDLLKENC